ncbi:MAG: PepSY domain-containing protein [Roseiarcus sp.]
MDAPYEAAAVDDEISALPARGAAKSGVSTLYRWSFVVHKWIGLIAALWIAVLGLTGFFLDHESWRWQNQTLTPAWLTTPALEQSAKLGLVRLLQIDPGDRAHEVAGGPRGLWVSRDAGETWQATAFANGDRPQILAIEPDGALGWKRLWLAADDGVYLSDDGGAIARQATLRGDYVTSLAVGAAPSEMIAVVDHSRVVRFKTDDPATATPIALAPPGPEARPDGVGLNRFMRELHFGKGVVDPFSSVLMSDVGGVGMFVLPITGVLFWALPKWWRARARRKDRARTSKATKKATVLWLFRLHSVTLGVASALMIVYLSVSGIFIGHSRELGAWMRSVHIPQAYLTPIFAIHSWNDWIDSVVAYPGKPDALTIGNRVGLFTTLDGGKSWTLDKGADGRPLQSAGRLRRLDDKVLVPNGMAGPSLIRDADLALHQVDVGDQYAPMAMATVGEHRHARPQNGEAGAGGAMAGMDHAQPTDHPHHMGGMGGTSGMAGMGDMDSMANMFMPSDVTPLGDKFAWKTTDKLLVTDADGRIADKIVVKAPNEPGVPLSTWFLRIHMGTIFWSQWKWVNDVFAIAAVLLSVTGLIRWQRKKWA